MTLTIYMNILLIFAGLCFIWCFIQLWRNSQVYHYREGVRDAISKAADVDIENNRPWIWRYELWFEVDYMQMCFQFWRPLDSFIDKRMIDPEATYDKKDTV